MTEQEYDELVSAACSYLEQRNSISWSTFDLDSYTRYYFNQDTGIFTFTMGQGPEVYAHFQAIGSISERSGTWLWAWANPSIRDELKRAAMEVKAFGDEHGIAELLEAQWPATEADGWAMTALAARLVEAPGAYSCPIDQGRFFVLFMDLQQQSPGAHGAKELPGAAY